MANWTDLKNAKKSESKTQDQKTDWSSIPYEKAGLSAENTSLTASTPEVSTTPRITDTYWTPTRVQDEYIFRKSPEYISPIPDVSDQELESVANYVSHNKKNHPDLWTNGDPGWREDDSVWTNYISKWKVPEVQEEPKPETSLNDQLAPIMGEEPKQTESVQPSVQQTEEEMPMTRQQTYQEMYDRALGKMSPELRQMIEVDLSQSNPDNLDTAGKVKWYATPSTAGTDVEGFAKLSQPFITSLMSTGASRAVTEFLLGLVAPSSVASKVASVVQAADFAYTYGVQTGYIERNETIDKIKEKGDIADEWGQIKQGKLAYANQKIGGGDITDAKHIYQNLKYVLQHWDEFTDAWKNVNKEYSDEAVNIVFGSTADMGAAVIGAGNATSRLTLNLLNDITGGGEKGDVKKGQVTRANSGLPGVFTLPEGTYGQEALEPWLKIVQGWLDEGIPEDVARGLFQNKIATYYGDEANASQMIEHEMGDFSNTVENITPYATYGVGKVIGDKNLQVASQQNMPSPGMVVADQFLPGSSDVLRQVGLAAGQQWKTAGSLNDILDTYDIQNKYGNLENTTAIGRRYSGIDEEGKIKDFGTPLADPKKEQNIFKRVGTELKNFFSQTNETKASFEGDAIFDYIVTGVEDAISARGNEDTTTTVNRMREFINELENPEIISEGSPFYESSQSAMFNTIKDDLAMAVKSHRQQIDRAIQRFADLDKERATLNALADALNMKPSQVLDMYDKQKTVLAQMIVNKADQNGGKLPGIDVDVEGREFGEKVLGMIKPFTGDDAQAWDVRQLTMQLTTAIGDGVTETLINKYNFKPDAIPYRFADMIKKMQNLLLLGLSPSYLANNLINNVVTRGAIGYSGFMTSGQIDSFTKRFGFVPQRLSEGNTEYGSKQIGNQNNYEKLQAGIKDKKTVKDFMYKVGKAASQASNMFGLFGNLSGLVERSESEQVMTSAMMTYLARTWKPGVNFRKMSAQLEAAINAKNPGMVKAIYSAISAGMNMAEIEDAIYGTYIAPSVYDTLYQAAQNVGIAKPDDVVTEYFSKGMILDQLNLALKGKRGDEIGKVIDEFAGRLKEILSVQLAEDLKTRAATVAQQVGEEAYFAAIDLAKDMSAQMNEVWLGSQNANSKLFTKRIREGTSQREFHALYSAQQKLLTDRWKSVYATNLQTYSGILQGLGMDEQYKTAYLDALGKKNDIWTKFYEETQPGLIQPYLDSLIWTSEDTMATWDARVKEAWKTYKEAADKAYKDATIEENNLQIDMDKAYADGLRASVSEANKPNVDKIIVPKLEEIRKKREAISELNEKIRKQADEVPTINQQDVVWKDNMSELENLKKAYANAQQELYESMRAFAPQTVAISKDYAQSDIDYKAVINADKIARVAKKAKEDAESYAKEQSSKIIDEKFGGVFAENPEEWNEALRQKRIVDYYINVEKMSKSKAEYRAKRAAKLLDTLPDEVKNVMGDNTLRPDKKYTKAIQELNFEYGEMLDTFAEEFKQKHGRRLNYEEYDALTKYIQGNNLDTHTQKEYTDASQKILDTQNTLFTDTLLKKEVESVERIKARYDKAKDTIGALTDIHDKYFLNRETAERVAIRAGATRRAAQAFSEYLTTIADKWDQFHPGEDFFKELNIETIFHRNANWSDQFYNGEKREHKTAGSYSVWKNTLNVFEDGTFESLLHELGHGLHYMLNDSQTAEMANYLGMSVDEYNKLRNDYVFNQSSLSTEDIQKWKHGTELFARGFVDYLNNGNAPTRGMVQIFEQFRNFIRGIFQQFKNPNEVYKKHQTYDGIFAGDVDIWKKVFDNFVIPSEDEVSQSINNGHAIQLDYIDLGSVPVVNIQGVSIADVPQKGTWYQPMAPFKYGAVEVKGMVVENGKIVAYVPTAFPDGLAEMNGDNFKVIGYSPRDPVNFVYKQDDDIVECDVKKYIENGVGINVNKPNVEQNTIPDNDPVPQAHNQMSYEQIMPILEEFKRLYPKNIDNAMTQNKFGDLDETTRAQIREYIDKDIRTDLMNTKYKTGKFGELMRDSALLNYNNRYGFDNALTLLCPYQFWTTRSFNNWMKRMGGHSRLWRRYARMKELEERNKKEIMPSRVTGKPALYVPGLEDWMGDGLFMPTDQTFVVGSFVEPVMNYQKKHNAVIATAERYIQESYEENDITPEQFKLAMNPETRENSPEWQEAIARAQISEGSDQNIASLLQEYTGMALPLSIAQAVMTGDQTKFTQFPMTKFGNEWRSTIGDNLVGNLGQAVLSAPERALRSALSKKYGDAFAYKELGSFGEYYIRGQVWDMAVEGRISADDAMQACIEKDGNSIWDEAAERQRQELLLKTQWGSAAASIKQLVKDLASKIKDNDSVSDEKIRDDWMYLLAGVLTAPFPNDVVRESEREWRGWKQERKEAYAAQDAGEEGAVNKVYDEHPMLGMTDLRYESDDEQAFRKYLYKKITDAYYDLDEEDRRDIRASFGTPFQERVLSNETRAIETMDLDDLLAYAQALTGKVPYIATDKLNTYNFEPIAVAQTPQEEKDANRAFLEWREKEYPGMADISNIYYGLEPEDREVYRLSNPDLDAYLKAYDKYKDEHEDFKNYAKRKSDYNNLLNAEKVFGTLDPVTTNKVKYYARSGKELPDEWKTSLEIAMRKSGITSDYDYFWKIMKEYILGE